MVDMTTEIYSEDLEKQALFKTLNLSFDVQDFITKNSAGQILMAKVTEELLAARSALEDVSPKDTTKIIELQTHAAAARKVITWLGEAISSGNDAENILTSHEE